MDAVLLIDKPAGYTSHDIIAAIKRYYYNAAMPAAGSAIDGAAMVLSRIGHAGTLDPLGTGLLVVLLNGATTLQELFMGDVKEYEGTFRLGLTTTSDDVEGEIIKQLGEPKLAEILTTLTPGRLAEVAAQFTGTILQQPPAVSAVHVDGKRSYKLARESERKNEEAKLPAPREVTIFSLELSQTETSAVVHYRVRASKGTYVRSLARDIGAALGCGAVVETLRRTLSGAFSVNDAATCEIVDRQAKLTMKERSLLPVEVALNHLPEVELSSTECQRVLSGERKPLEAVVEALPRLRAREWARVMRKHDQVPAFLSFIVQKTEPMGYKDGIPLQIRYRATDQDSLAF